MAHHETLVNTEIQRERSDKHKRAKQKAFESGTETQMLALMQQEAIFVQLSSRQLSICLLDLHSWFNIISSFNQDFSILNLL